MAIQAYRYWNAIKMFAYSTDRYASWALFIVEEGTFQYAINGIINQASTGEIVICPPNTDFHRKVVSRELTFHYILFDWRETHSQIEQDIRNILSATPLQKFTIQESDRLASTLNHLRKVEITIDSAAIVKQREHFLNDLWLTYYLEIQSNSGNLNVDPLMQEVKTMIDRNAYGSFLLMNVAEHFHLSKVQLTRRFRQSYGITPMNYFTELRLKRAKFLLANSDHPLAYIAQACGYDNGNYLSRIFVKHVGMTPSQYRKLHQI
jgi:AraC family transcriptional regulator